MNFQPNQWTVETPQPKKKGDLVDTIIELPEGTQNIDIEVKAPDEATLSLVDENGQVFPIKKGQELRLKQRVLGIVAIVITASNTFCYRTATKKGKWLEIPDPTPLEISERISSSDYQRDRLKVEVIKELHRRKIFAEDVDPVELAEDILEGDLEFHEEEEFTDFGEGHMEPDPDFEQGSPPDMEPDEGGDHSGVSQDPAPDDPTPGEEPSSTPT